MLLPAIASDQLLLVPRPEWGTIVVTGEERQSWLNGIVSNDLARLGPGRGVWSLVLTRTGKIEGEIHVIADSDRLLVATSPGTARSLAASLDRMLIMEDAELREASEDFFWLSIHGRGAASAANSMLQSLGVGATAAFDWAAPESQLVVVPRAASPRALEVGAGIAAIASPEAWLVWRLEHALPEFGVDYTERSNPHEAALERRAVSWNKGCYLGQEVVCMQEMRGKVRRRSKSLLIDSDAALPAGAPVVDPVDGKVVGEVTSAAWSPSFGKVVALALINNDYDAGRAVRVRDVPAVVAERRPS